ESREWHPPYRDAWLQWLADQRPDVAGHPASGEFGQITRERPNGATAASGVAVTSPGAPRACIRANLRAQSRARKQAILYSSAIISKTRSSSAKACSLVPIKA